MSPQQLPDADCAHSQGGTRVRQKHLEFIFPALEAALTRHWGASSATALEAGSSRQNITSESGRPENFAWALRPTNASGRNNVVMNTIETNINSFSTTGTVVSQQETPHVPIDRPTLLVALIEHFPGSIQ